MTPNSISAALNTIADIVSGAKKYKRIMDTSQSLASVTQPLRVEPLFIVDDSLIYATDIMPDVAQTLQSQFTGFWLQAVDIIGDDMSAKAVGTLSTINPTRDADLADFFTKMASRTIGREGLYFSKEAYKYGLPTDSSHQVRNQAVENTKTKPINVNELTNLAVGKMIEVGVGRGDNRREFKVNIRLIAVDTDQETLTNMAADPSSAAGFMSRLHSYQNDDIGLMDLLFCVDLVRERKRQLLKDKHGIYEEVRKRQLAHKRAGLTTGVASMAEASNVVALSSEFVQQLQLTKGLDITDFGDRAKIMDNLQALIIAVVDRRDMRVQFYHNGIRRGSSVGINDIRIANRKQNGPDVMDIFAALKEGAPPRY